VITELIVKKWLQDRSGSPLYVLKTLNGFELEGAALWHRRGIERGGGWSKGKGGRGRGEN